MHLDNRKKIMICIAPALLIVFSLANPAAAYIEISDFFSDFTSSDVTIVSGENLQGRAVFELFFSGSLVESHEVPFNARAGEPVYKVILWETKPQHDYYTAKLSLYDEGKLLVSKTYPVSYGTVALPSFHVVDFSPTNTGVQLLLRPFNPSAVDIKIELLDNNDVVYSKTREDVSLVTSAEIRMLWPFLLVNNERYTVRAKIYTHRLYASPLINTYTAFFIANRDVEILPDDVEVDDYGASVTIRGRSQVPFDGSILVITKNRATNETRTYTAKLEEILVSGKEDTAGIVWRDLAPGTYDVVILAVDHENVALDRYETVFRIPEETGAAETPGTKSTPGFAALVSMIIILAASRRLKGA